MRSIEQDIKDGKNGKYLIATYGEDAKNWAKKVLNKKNDDYATNLYLAHFVSYRPTVNSNDLFRQDLAREILERNVWQYPFSKAYIVGGIPKKIWINKVKEAIENNKHIPEQTLNEYKKLIS